MYSRYFCSVCDKGYKQKGACQEHEALNHYLLYLKAKNSEICYVTDDKSLRWFNDIEEMKEAFKHDQLTHYNLTYIIFEKTEKRHNMEYNILHFTKTEKGYTFTDKTYLKKYLIDILKKKDYSNWDSDVEYSTLLTIENNEFNKTMKQVK